MSAPQFIPILEMLILNLITFDRCCERKYTAVRTVLINTLFTATVCVLIKIASLFLPIRGDGNLLLGGFIYLLPLTYLYQENIIACFIVKILPEKIVNNYIDWFVMAIEYGIIVVILALISWICFEREEAKDIKNRIFRIIRNKR